MSHRVGTRRPRQRLLLATFVALGTALAPPSLHAACVALTSGEFRDVDRASEGDPARAVSTARSALSAPADRLAPFQRAELEAILADAYTAQSRPDEADVAIAEARRLLAPLKDDADVRRLRSRLRITEADTAGARNDPARGLEQLDELMSELPPRSEERACALAVRLEMDAMTNAIDRAAADGLNAYRMAADGQWPRARIMAAYGLASVYERAGLLEDGEKMIKEVIAYAGENDLKALRTFAEFSRAHILIDMQRYPEAIEALKINRDYSERLGDPVGVAAANLMTCLSYASQKDYAAAEASCRGGDEALRTAQRTDLLGVLHGLRGEIALGTGHPSTAIELLTPVLAANPSAVAMQLQLRFLRDQADAYRALGRPDLAYASLAGSTALEQKYNLSQRLRTVAVLSASADTERLLADNRFLEARLAQQRMELETKQRAWRFSLGIAGLAALAAGLFGYLQLTKRRQSAQMRRQDAIARTIAAHAPDALVLLDGEQQVRFSNRDLFGGPTPLPGGGPLDGSIPPAARDRLKNALERLYARRSVVNFEVALGGETGDERHFELTCAPAVVDDELVGAIIRSIDVTVLRKLQHEVTEVANRERHRLSGDLHEGLGQQLTGVVLTLRSVLTGLDRGKPVPRHIIAELLSHVSESIETTREIARGLSPVKIERGSLSDALGRLATESTRRLGIEVTLVSTPAGVTVGDSAADHLYRITQEAITNAARHAQCTRVDVRLTQSADELAITVADDGATPLSPDSDHDGLGLKMMTYRARLLGGSLAIGGASPSGTRITVRVPAERLGAPATQRATGT